jgi:hypothetical protein
LKIHREPMSVGLPRGDPWRRPPGWAHASSGESGLQWGRPPVGQASVPALPNASFRPEWWWNGYPLGSRATQLSSLQSGGLMSQADFFVYRRRLPHWRLNGATYFVTWRLQRSQHALSPAERSMVVKALRFFEKDRYDLFAYVVMDDPRPSSSARRPSVARHPPLLEILHRFRASARERAAWGGVAG